MQSVAVAFIVAACAAFAAWSLMPAAARRGMAVWLLKRPLPAVAARRLQKTLAVAGSSCGGCGGGCASAPAAPAKAEHKLTFHPRVHRQQPGRAGSR